MDYRRFYKKLFTPLTETLGPIDKNAIAAIVGFDAGGPLNFCTIGRNEAGKVITYVSCELAVREEQKPSSFGRYELLASCDSEDWVRSVLSDTGRMTFDVTFDDGHTMDIGAWVNDRNRKRKPMLQGLLFKKECATIIERKSYGVLRCIGVSRPEMAFAQKHGVSQLVSRLKQAEIYPNTLVGRSSII